MQFPKAKRFQEPNPDEIPPVGAYSIEPLAEPIYKRGAMLEKDKRFHENGTQVPDTFGIYGNENENPLKKRNSLMVGGNGIDKLRLQMEDMKTRMTNQHEKELAKLIAKIGRLEAAREEGVKERQEMSKELLGVKSELRSSTSREQALTTKLTKAESSLTKHQALLPTLQTKLDQLTTSHVESRKRKEAEIIGLNEKLEKKEEELLRLRDENRENRRIVREERWSREEICRTGERVVKDLYEKTRNTVLDYELKNAKIVAELKAEIDQKDKTIIMMKANSRDLELQLTLAEELLVDSYEIIDGLMKERASDREELRSEKEWRQRARSDQRDATGLREDADYLLTCVELDRDLKKASAWLDEVKTSDLQARIVEADKELEIVEGELDLAVNDEIPRLEGELELTKEGLEEMRDRVLELQESVEEKEGEVKELQERAIAEIERFEGTLEEERRRYMEKEKEVEKERADKRRITSLLGQARSAEAALTEERDALLAELQEAENLRTTHQNLVANLDYLARENAATREDNVLLVEQNAELASHQNSRQKIQVHAATRAQLADARRAQLAVTSKLASSEARIAQLEGELEGYRSVSSLPFSKSTMTKSTGRTRVTRPILSDVVNDSPAPNGPKQSESHLMPPPALPKQIILFATNTGEDAMSSGVITTTSRQARRVTMAVSHDEGENREAAVAPGRLRRLSSGGVRMTGKMSLSELL